MTDETKEKVKRGSASASTDAETRADEKASADKKGNRQFY
jgi:hypothetical protein